MRFAIAATLYCFVLGLGGTTGATPEELARKEQFKLAKDPRAEHRQRLLVEAQEIMMREGIKIHPSYERRRKLVDVDDPDFHSGARVPEPMEAEEEEALLREDKDAVLREDIAFWQRLLQGDGDGSLVPTAIPTRPPRPATEVPVQTPVPPSPPPPVPTTPAPVVPATPAPVSVTPAPQAAPTPPGPTPPVPGLCSESLQAIVNCVAEECPGATTAGECVIPEDADTCSDVEDICQELVECCDGNCASQLELVIERCVPGAVCEDISCLADGPETPAPVVPATPAPQATPTTPAPTPAPQVAPTTPAPVTVTPAPVAVPATPAPVAVPATPAPVAVPATPAPVQTTPAPVATPECAARSVIEPVALFGGTEFQDPASYQSKSLDWLCNSATAGLSDARIIQRYSLGSIWFATYNVSTSFTDQALGQGMIVPWIRTRGWITDENECDWINIECDGNNNVIILDLFTNLVTGEFPPEVVYLKETLQTLDLGMNLVFSEGDTINTYLGQLTQLSDLRYESTNFINNNGIPVEIGNLKKLAFYNVAETRYVGALNGAAFPSDMTQLTHLEIEMNAYNSSIPVAIGQLPALKFFYARNSFIDGDLEFMRPMQSIQECWVDTNPGLGGQPLPTFLGSISTLASFSVTECGFIGNLPTEIGQLGSSMLKMFYFDNEFTGPIPDEWTSLMRLQRLELQENMLTGLIPTGICVLTFASLTTLIADCVNCPANCCTGCI